MIKTLAYCDRCGAQIGKSAFMAFICCELYNTDDDAEHFEYRLCAPCWCGYRNTFSNKEGE